MHLFAAPQLECGEEEEEEEEEEEGEVEEREGKKLSKLLSTCKICI